MDYNDTSSEETLKLLKNEIVQGTRYKIGDILTSELMDYSGVYILLKPYPSNIILYIGKSDTSVRCRLLEHKDGKEKNDLNQIILKFHSYPRIIDNYIISAKKIEDKELRRQLENYLKTTLDYKFKEKQFY